MSPLTKWNPFRTQSPWDPFRDLENLENRLASIWGRAPTRANGEQEETANLAEWSPPVDITEDDKEYTIKAELPDIKKEDVKVTVQDGVLNIAGERKLEKEEKGKTYHRIERAYGSFQRSFTVPENADSNKVNASFKDGVLMVKLPKTEKAQSKKVDVKVA